MTWDTKSEQISRIAVNSEELLESTLTGKLISIFTIVDVALLFVIFGFIAWTKDMKTNRERKPTFIPKRPPNGFRLYAVLLETGLSPAGGTSSKIILRMCGRLTKSPAFSLVCDSGQRSNGVASHHFDSQNKDLFILAVPHYLGQLYAFEVMTNRKGDCPPWYLKCIRVMCLDNRKCWKSSVSMWLRGDQKPYHIKAASMGAISTRQHFNKVFLHNHLWTFTWYRSLGSGLSSLDRFAIHWASLGFAMTAAHYFLYDYGLVENIELQYVKTPSYNSNDVVMAALIASIVGVVLGSGLRMCCKLLMGRNPLKWERVDDKDDFKHIMDADSLDYPYGAVIQFDRKHESHFCTQQISHLTPSQIDILRHIANCQKPNCNTKYGRKNCGTLDCPLDPLDDNVKDIIMDLNDNKESGSSDRKRLHSVWRDDSRRRGSGLRVRLPEDMNVVETDDNESCKTEEPEDFEKVGFFGRFKARLFGERKNKEEIVDALVALDPSFGVNRANRTGKFADEVPNAVQETCFVEESSASTDDTECDGASASTVREYDSGSYTSCSGDDSVFPVPSAGRRMKESDRNKKDPSCHLCQTSVVPAVSARSTHPSSDTEIIYPPTHPMYDSLSESESDVDVMTKAAKTISEMKLSRRPNALYAMVPLWYNRKQVYVRPPQEPDYGHQKRLNERYSLTQEEGECCLHNAGSLDQAVDKYLVEEEDCPDGRVRRNSSAGIISVLACSAAVLATAATAFMLYQRLAMPNAETLNFFYAVLLSIICHGVVFSSLDALFWALFACWTRRRTALKKRTENAVEILSSYPPPPSDIGQEDAVLPSDLSA